MRAASLALALLGCAPVGQPLPAAAQDRPRPATVLAGHPECAESTGTVPVLNVGCWEHCAPRILGRVCTDLGEVVYVPSVEPLKAPFGRVLREGGCWEILELDPTPRHYTDVQFTWAAHPADGQPCVGDRLPQDWGWFDRIHGLLDFHPARPAQLSE